MQCSEARSPDIFMEPFDCGHQPGGLLCIIDSCCDLCSSRLRLSRQNNEDMCHHCSMYLSAAAYCFATGMRSDLPTNAAAVGLN